MVETVTLIKKVITMSVIASVKILYNIYFYKQNIYIWNPATCSSEDGKYLASTIECSITITCDETIEQTETVTKKV